MNIIKTLNEFNPEKLLAWISHADSISRFFSYAFLSGKSKAPGEGTRESHRQTVNAAIDLTAHRQLDAELMRDGYTEPECANIFIGMGRFFHGHPEFIDAFRKSMSGNTDMSARIANLKQFALADDDLRLYLCQQIDQRRFATRVLADRFIEVGRTWDRAIRQMALEDAKHLYEFMNQLSWLESRQFAASIGGIKLDSDRNACLDEVLATHPDRHRMREIAVIRGLINPSAVGKAVGEAAKLAKKLATPRPHDPAELAREQELLRQEKDAARAAFARNPIFRLFNRLFNR